MNTQPPLPHLTPKKPVAWASLLVNILIWGLAAWSTYGLLTSSVFRKSWAVILFPPVALILLWFFAGRKKKAK